VVVAEAKAQVVAEVTTTEAEAEAVVEVVATESVAGSSAKSSDVSMSRDSNKVVIENGRTRIVAPRGPKVTSVGVGFGRGLSLGGQAFTYLDGTGEVGVTQGVVEGLILSIGMGVLGGIPQEVDM